MDPETKRLIAELHRRLGAEPEGPGPTLRALWEAYWTEEGQHKRSAKAAKFWMASVLAWRPAADGPALGDMPVSTVTRTTIRAYIAARLLMPGRAAGSTISGGTLYSEISQLKRCLNWSVEAGLITDHGLKKFRAPAGPRRKGSIRGDAITKLLAELPDWMQVLVLVAAYIGARIDIVRVLRWDEIDLDTGHVRPSTPDSSSKKRGAPRLVGPALEAVRAMAAARDLPSTTALLRASPWVFTSDAPKWRKRAHPFSYSHINRMFREAAERAGVTTVDGYATLHHLRHGFALEALESWGWSIKVLMSRGGWSTVNAVMRYGALDRDADDAAQARAEEAIALRAALARRKGPVGVVRDVGDAPTKALPDKGQGKNDG